MLRHLALPTLRARWTAYVGVLVSIVTAVTVMTACGVLLASGIGGGVPPERFVGADIVVSRHQAVSERHGHGDDAETIHTGVVERLRLPSDTLTRLAATPGVAAATADVSFSAMVLDSSGVLLAGFDGGDSLGHGWSAAQVTPFALLTGHAPAAPGEVVLDDELAARAHLSTGDPVHLVVGGRPVEGVLAGTARPDRPLRSQSAVFFSDAEATAHFAHPGLLDAVLLNVEPDADVRAVARDLSDELGDDYAVLTGDRRGSAELLESVDANTRLIAISGSLLGIAVCVAIFVVSGMLGVLIQQRHREIALLRAIAATPRQIRRLIGRETLVLTLLGTIIGLWPGMWLAEVIIEGMRGQDLLPATFRSTPGPIPMLAALGGALLIALGSTAIAGRRASKVRPIEALADAAVPTVRLGPIRILLGLVTLAGTACLFLVAMSFNAGIAQAVAPALVMCGMVVVGLFAPWLCALGVRAIGLVTRHSGATGYLATQNTRAYARRLAAAVTPLVLTLAIAGMTIFQQSTLQAETNLQQHDRMVADRVMSSEPGLPFDRLAELQGLGEAVGFAPTTIYAGDDLDSHPAQVITEGRLDAVLDLDTGDTSLSGLAPDEIALADALASEMGATVGETVRIRLGDGTPVDMTVAAIFQRSMGFGAAVLPWSSTAEHLTEARIGTVLLRTPASGPIPDATLTEIENSQPGLTIGGPELVAATADASADANEWIAFALLGMVIVFAAFAVVNTLTLATADRSREFALLRLVGATRSQVLRMMRWESLTVIGLGIALGTVVALITLVPFCQAVTGSMVPVISPAPVLALVAFAIALGLLGTQVPTRLALRAEPVDAIGIRD